MIKECLEIYKKLPFVPPEIKNSTCYLANIDKQEIRKVDNKSEFVKTLNFYSTAISSNKFIDAPKKKIHSNNMYSVFFKEENYDSVKGTFLNNYYNCLLKIDNKNKKTGSIFCKKYDSINTEELEEIRNFLTTNFDKVEKTGEDKKYIKIFIVKDKEEETINLYKQEYMRYMYQYVPLKPDFVEIVEDKVYTAPSNFISYNTNKSFLVNSIGFKSPFVLEIEDAIKLFEMAKTMEDIAKQNRYVLYVDVVNDLFLLEKPKNFNGYKLTFSYENKTFTIVNCESEEERNSLVEIKEVIKNRIDVKDVISRKELEEMFLNKSIDNIIRNSIRRNVKPWQLTTQINYYINYKGKELELMNFREEVSNKLKNEENLTTDNEMLYAMGQVLRKIQYNTEAKDKNMNFILEFLDCKDSEKIKEKFAKKLNKYAHNIKAYNYMENPVISQILTHDFERKVDYKMVVAGYLDENYLFKRKED